MTVRGAVQGVGFRPFVYRLALRCGLSGWVENDGAGVTIHAEGADDALAAFLRDLQAEAPPAARIDRLSWAEAGVEGFAAFQIRESVGRADPTVPMLSDLPACGDCLRELFDPSDRRYGYPFVACTACGPRYSILRELPFDRERTTMADWPMCAACRREYEDPLDRRFHAQAIACPACGPGIALEAGESAVEGGDAIRETVRLLREGAIVGIKGIGGFHLACDARNPRAVSALRERKYRKERPFALMVRDVAAAERLVEIAPAAGELLQAPERPIVLMPAKVRPEGVAPENGALGIMLPYAPLHHLLFAGGAPEALVMTSANRSNEPLVYRDGEARERLAGIADALLVGARAIARRVDDSVVRAGPGGPTILRRARGYAPAPVARLPSPRPILAVGADLKNAVTLVVDGQAFGSQHVGDLEQRGAYDAFVAVVRDLCAAYGLAQSDLLVAHDAHPEYASTAFARGLGAECVAIQHHRAHVASVLAERGALTQSVLGIAFDGTGYGDDGAIWGGEIFRGSVARGFDRIGRLRSAWLVGGDAAARFPVVAAAGFLAVVPDVPDVTQPPFSFPDAYRRAQQAIRSQVRCLRTTSAGRLFDAVAALCGFDRENTFEGQAAMWLEHRAGQARGDLGYEMPYAAGELDFRPLLAAVARDRLDGRPNADIARAFHVALADGIAAACAQAADLPVVLSGGVFQNALLVDLLAERLGDRLWRNHRVPPNDGGISLGQAALASVAAPKREAPCTKQA